MSFGYWIIVFVFYFPGVAVWWLFQWNTLPENRLNPWFWPWDLADLVKAFAEVSTHSMDEQ